MTILPYLVLMVVVVLFFIACYITVYGARELCPFLKRRKEKKTFRQRTAKEKQISEDRATGVPYDNESTQALPLHGLRMNKMSEEADKTRVISRKKLEGKKTEKNVRMPFAEEEKPTVLKTVSLSSLEEYFVRHFLNRYGAVSSTVEKDTRVVTKALLEKLHMKGDEVCDTLTHIMVQEALQNVQRAYVMMPCDLILHIGAEAFNDVAWGRRGETKTAVAYDALRILPRLEERGLHVLALLFLFHYSRNTENTNEDTWRSYALEYIRPFLAELPKNYDGYRQLEYLHCIASTGKETPFGEVLRDAYPLVFSYRGYKKEEWEALLPEWPKKETVRSLYVGYEKPDVVDEGLLVDRLAAHGIEGDKVQHVLSLVRSRPVPYDRKEMTHILKLISPDLAQMQEIWDTSLLRRSSLTLIGMYIARLVVKDVIGEEFDMSDWM